MTQYCVIHLSCPRQLGNIFWHGRVKSQGILFLKLRENPVQGMVCVCLWMSNDSEWSGSCPTVMGCFAEVYILSSVRL